VDTFAQGISLTGAVVGNYLDASYVNHGFLRTSDGSYILFDAPGAGTGAGQGTVAEAADPAGVIAGLYIDASDVARAFVRTPDGRYTTFDAPGAGTVVGSYQGTYPMAISPVGAITGYYLDANNVEHGFLRLPMP
jgi:hypothetical protein